MLRCVIPRHSNRINRSLLCSFNLHHIVPPLTTAARWCSTSVLPTVNEESPIVSGGVSHTTKADWIRNLTAEDLALLSSRLTADGASSASSSSAKSTLPNSILRSIVKIYASSMEPSAIMPWQLKQQISVTGSGFVMDKERRIIATNAHVVQCAHLVEVRKHGDSEQYRGHVAFVAADCDLAFVYIADDKFWEETSLQALPFYSVSESSNQSVMEVLAERHASYEPFSGLPSLQGSVKVAGYPVGGDQISITSGVVSRIDVSSYGQQASNAILAIQLDAAINSGNSGGPALNHDSQVVGVAFQVLMNADNIGYIIPLPVIGAVCHRFLEDPIGQRLTALSASRQHQTQADTTTNNGGATANASIDAITERSYCPALPTLSITFQALLNPFLRKHVQSPTRAVDNSAANDKASDSVSSSGVLVRYITPTSCVQDVLQQGDVLLSIDQYRIDHDATVEYRPRERISFAHLVHVCPPGKALQLAVLRNGQRVEVQATPRPHRHLSPPHFFTPEFKEWPKCVAFAGLVFSTLTQPLLAEWGREWYNSAPRWLVQSAGEYPTPEREEAIVLVQVLPHAVNKQYDRFYAHMIAEVDGVPVANFEAFRALLQTRVTQYREKQKKGLTEGEEVVVLSTTVGTQDRGMIVLPLKEALQANEELHQRSGIPLSFP